MNQRLTELYRSCRPTEALVSQDQFGSANVLLGTEVEKFAELIAQECVEVALAQKKWVENQEVFGVRDADWNQARIQQSQHIIDKIKEHFGIEL
jgi:hypothetical protein